MDIEDILDNRIYYNKNLAEESKKHEPNLISILKKDYEPDGRYSEGRWNLDFRNLDLDKGEEAVSKLGFSYIRYDTKEVMDIFRTAEEQTCAMPQLKIKDMLICRLSEWSFHQFLNHVDMNLIKRKGHIYNNLYGERFGPDIVLEKGKTLGVRCQHNFSGDYLYSKDRVFRQRHKIPDYVAFFNHFQYHILYVTGIVEKDFLSADIEHHGKGFMHHFPMPEMYKSDMILKEYCNHDLNKKDIPDDIIQGLNTKFSKRMGMKGFLDRVFGIRYGL